MNFRFAKLCMTSKRSYLAEFEDLALATVENLRGKSAYLPYTNIKFKRFSAPPLYVTSDSEHKIWH